MALRKIKDLIREMVFDNQSNAHQYAEVMANLVFDRNQADEYEKSLESAEDINQRYDEQIQEINAELDKAKSTRNEIVSRKKDMSNEEFRTLMANAQQEVKQLEGVQRDTIAEKIQKGFRNLSPTIKKYGCLRYLANEYVKNAEFKTEIGADGFIYADEYEFKSSEMARNFREISDYVDYIFGNRESKITEPKSIVDIIRADAKELDLTIDKLTPENIVNIYNNLLARIAEENRNKQTEKEQIEQSQIGIKPVRDFGNGLVMYRLLPDTEYYNEHGEHRNLVYESDQMGICIGQKGQSYSQKILNQDENQYYTLRSRNKNGQLIPHCTIEVNGDVVSQVKGKANGAVNGKYIKQVREFLKNDLNCAFPGEKPNERKLYDYSNIGFVRDIHDNTVDLFNLPQNTELGTISYDLLSVKGIDFKNIKSVTRLDAKNTTITQKDIAIIAQISMRELDLFDAKSHGKLDLSNTNLKEIHLFRTDLTNAEIILPKSIEKINLYDAKLHGKLDLSNTNLTEIDLSKTDLTDAEIILPKSVEEIDLSYAKLHGKYDFSNTNLKDIDLGTTDLTNAEIIFPKSVEEIDLSYAKLHGKYDFSNTNLKEIYLDTTDLTNAEIIFPKSVEGIDLSYAKLHGKYDFSNTNLKEIYLDTTDLTNAEIIVGRNTKIMELDEKYKNKIVVLQSESKVDVFNKGTKNLKNKINEATQKLKAKMSDSGRNND